MKLTLKQESYLIFDEVLEATAFSDVWNYFQSIHYEALNVSIPGSPWTVNDGSPFVGRQAVAAGPRSESFIAQHNRMLAYPSMTPLDNVLKIVLEIAEQQSMWLKCKGMTWDIVSACPYVYPQGTSLSWHSDLERVLKCDFIRL